VIIENNEHELICGYCKIFELVILFPQKFLNLNIKLIEKDKNVNFNNYKNQEYSFSNSKTAKNITAAKIDFDIGGYNKNNINNKDEKINFSHSTNDYGKNAFMQARMLYSDKDNSNNYIPGKNYNNNNYVYKGREFLRNISDGKLEPVSANSLRKSSDFYSGRNNNLNPNNNSNSNLEKNILNLNEKYDNEINNKNINNPSSNNYRNNTNPHIYENRNNNYENNKKEKEGDLMNIKKDFGDLDGYDHERKSRPLSVNKYSSKYLDKVENGFDYNETHRLDSADFKNNMKYSSSKMNNNNNLYYENHNVSNPNYNVNDINQNALNNNNNCKIRTFASTAEEQLPMRNYSNKSNSANKSLAANSLPETNLNYDSNTFKKYNNYNPKNNINKNNEYNNSNNLNNNENKNNNTNKYFSYKYTSTDDNIKNTQQGEFDVNRNLDDIISVEKYNSNNENNLKKNENKNANFDSYNSNQAYINSSKIKYLSEKRMFRDKKEDQKNLISNFKNLKFNLLKFGVH